MAVLIGSLLYVRRRHFQWAYKGPGWGLSFAGLENVCPLPGVLALIEDSVEIGRVEERARPRLVVNGKQLCSFRREHGLDGSRHVTHVMRQMTPDGAAEMIAAAPHDAPEHKITTIDRAYSLLGGAKTLRREVHTTLDAHDMVMGGLPSETLFVLIHNVPVLAHGDALERAIGMSVRTVQRRRREPAPLSTEQSSRTWNFARIFAHAVEVLGSEEDAQEWMQRPALGLDNRPPIDFLGSAVGAEAVDHYLTRMEYGVYT